MMGKSELKRWGVQGAATPVQDVEKELRSEVDYRA
jgi:hypothetical protein